MHHARRLSLHSLLTLHVGSVDLPDAAYREKSPVSMCLFNLECTALSIERKQHTRVSIDINDIVNYVLHVVLVAPFRNIARDQLQQTLQNVRWQR